VLSNRLVISGGAVPVPGGFLMPDTRPPSPGRLFVIAVAAAVVCFVITLSFGYADHAPAPHGVRLAVAAPPATATATAPAIPATAGDIRS
jgi:hypothetical protein